MLINIYFGILILSFLAGIYRFPKLNRANKFFFILIGITLLSEIIASYFRDKKILTGNLIQYHIFHIIEYILICYGYFIEVKSKYIFWGIPLGVLLSIFLSIFIQPITSFNSYFVNTELFIFTLLSVWTLLKLLQIKTELSFISFPIFWVSIGWILYTVCNVFFFGTNNTYFQKGSIFETIFFRLLYFSNYLLYLAFTVGFLAQQNSLSNHGNKQ